MIKCDNCMQNGICQMKQRFLKMYPLGEITYCFDFTEKDSEPKPMTNGDKIRSMTDEELAELISEHVPLCAGPKKIQEQYSSTRMTTAEVWLNWLKQPVEVEI